MKQHSTLPTRFRQQIVFTRERIIAYLHTHWIKLVFLCGALWLAQHRDISVHLAFNGVNSPELSATSDPEAVSQATPTTPKPLNVSMLTTHQPAKTPPTKSPSTRVARSSRPTTQGTRAQRQQAYVRKYKAAAEEEMRRYGIPASITLAQGLLESNMGDSKLARENNNHFGIKCFSRTCTKGHCSNFTDDSHKDFFRIFKTPQDSYRAHSLLLRQPRYRRLFKLSRTDYQGWAKGLKSCGYATDRYYDQKIINLIRELRLHQYDK